MVSDLAHILRELQGMKVLLQVGLKRNSLKGKIDLLVGCDEGRIETYSPLIKSALKKRWPDGNFFVCDDSVRFDLQTSSGGVAVCDAAFLVQQVEEWIQGKNLGGQHRPWAAGYWLPEALCGDLATAKTLHDTTQTSERLKKLLSPYPASLSRNIIELCADEISQKLLVLDKLDAHATIERELCLADVTASMVRLAFARSRKYFRGYRSLEQQAKLLRPTDLFIYKLALELSERKKVKDVVGRIRKSL
ncbi:MAG: hypothetical protein KBB55_00015 [Candidatus Buchananbacteria bacterium]|nr:hypothetical protein [Candidatus Buchananbacteria bacterium]